VNITALSEIQLYLHLVCSHFHLLLEQIPHHSIQSTRNRHTSPDKSDRGRGSCRLTSYLPSFTISIESPKHPTKVHTACPSTNLRRRMSLSNRPPKDLQVVDPLPVADDRTPLLHRHSNGQACEEQDDEALEEQARQERREHDVGYVPVADELSTRRLVVTMGSMWLSTFFAALGTF
jgi:hypothetical protein